MKLKKVTAAALILALVCILWLPVSVSAASQGTDGTELQVLQPADLEIYLGPEWAGMEFGLETDAGTYPGTIPVGEDGVLRLEIGGSSEYILRCRPSNPEASLKNEAEQSEASGPDEVIITPETESTDALPETLTQTEEAGQGSVAGIPVSHIVLFAGGMIASLVTLFAIHLHQKGRAYSDPDDDI